MLPPLRAQRDVDAPALLRHALHLADFYNWVDAAHEFAEAETTFLASGDLKNALYARIGLMRGNLERGGLPARSAELAAELRNNPFLQSDKQMRMFCLTVKGDIDGESDHEAMRYDWEEVQSLARDLHDTEWGNRALGQLGLAAFYDGDIATARANVGRTLKAATVAGDVGGQILYSSVIGSGLTELQQYALAIPYFDQALKLATATPDSGYPFVTYQGRVNALIGLKRLDEAQHSVDDMLSFARQRHGRSLEAAALVLDSRIATARDDYRISVATLEQSVALCESGGLLQQLSEAQSLLADLYRKHGDLPKAEQLASEAATTAQSTGDLWAVPQRLQEVAELQVAQGKYADADHVYDRADAFVDAMVGKTGALLDKTGLIKASSEMYSQHFSLVADRFNNPAKAWTIVEQVRGRSTSDLLMAGSAASSEAKHTEHRISELRLSLTTARSNSDVQQIRDRIFVAEQSRWVNPEVSILKSESHRRIGIAALQRSLDESTVILEYVTADPRSYCLVISRSGLRIVPLTDTRRIEALTAAYLHAIKARQESKAKAADLYNALVRPIPEVARKERLVVIPDGRLNSLPFDALVDGSGRYLGETHTIVHSPSATSYYLLAKRPRRTLTFDHTLLAIGGVPYNQLPQLKASSAAAYDHTPLSELPGSKDEVLAARTAIGDRGTVLLLDSNATESAFKRANLAQFRIIHLAVHGVANTTHPDRSALVLLSDPSAGEDGLLQASEIVQLRLRADLVILSACDTAVGPVEGEEGIETLSKAFLLAGARAVVSTLWSVDDTHSLFLMTRFYAHLAAHEPIALALAAAKRDMLNKFGHELAPYYWAAFTLEGAAGDTIPFPGQALN
jgi:CHAT domain-containing protein